MNGSLLLLGVVCCAFFGMAAADVAFPDFVPPRPYDSVFVGFGMVASRKRHSGVSDYRPNRSHTQDMGQINERVEAYMARRLAEFVKAHPRAARRMGLAK